MAVHRERLRGSRGPAGPRRAAIPADHRPEPGIRGTAGDRTRLPGRCLPPRPHRCPETPGGDRNYDYRYTWLRDSTFMLWGLYTLGFDREANDFFYFITDLAEQDA